MALQMFDRLRFLLSTGVQLVLALGTLPLCLVPGALPAQELDQEVREKFERMLDDLDGDLRSQFQQALNNNTPVVEMTAPQFRRFREHPANPFDIDDIDPNDLDGKIELRFELPSLRNRPIQPFERQSRSLRRNIRDAVAVAAQSTVALTDGGRQLTLGTIVREDGYILTKHSEIKNAEQLLCQIGLNRVYPTDLININHENDLALLKVNASDLVAVRWSDQQPRNGSFVVTPDPQGEVVALGTYSVVARSTIDENQGFLGVAPRTVSGGVQIVDAIESDSAAYAAGLKMGDVITSIDGRAIKEVVELVNEIRRRRAGDEIEIDFVRNGVASRATAKLAGRSLDGERAARFKMMARLGAVPSTRDSGFPVAFQHDSPLFPEQCGGPICDLNGNVIGINISRESRAASYSIPAAHLKNVLKEMVREDIAAESRISR
jgi:serine protease Do